jgi:hypothetical protein
LGLSPVERLAFLVAVSAVGLVLGFFVPSIAESGVGLLWAPLEGALRLIVPFEGLVVVAWLVTGLVLGFGVAVGVVTGCLTVTLTDSQIRLEKGGTTRTIARSEANAVFVDGKKLVVLDGESRQLMCETHASTSADVARAFRSHGYPWVGKDPYAGLYRQWVPGTPDLPPLVNAIMAVREIALRKQVAWDVTELRDEVQRLGFVVRDEGARQYWRQLVSGHGTSSGPAPQG